MFSVDERFSPPWEYKTGLLPMDRDSQERTETALNAYGAEGWELVFSQVMMAAIPGALCDITDAPKAKPRLFCVFKRPVERSKT
jgi:hypothetical protein